MADDGPGGEIAHTPAAEGEDEFAQLQLEREREFLSFLCQPLAELPEHIAEDIVSELANQLRAKVSHSVLVN